MAQQLRQTYRDLYAANEYAHKLGKDELISKLRTVTGAAADDEVIPGVAGTFHNLARLADFNGKSPAPSKTPAESLQIEKSAPTSTTLGRSLGISYTINLNLPATTEIEVFNSIFKALKEHILHDQ
jgi:hypothetical protein